MSTTQSLPVSFPLAPTTRLVRHGALARLLARPAALAGHMLAALTDNTRLSAATLRDIGMVRGESAPVGAWGRERPGSFL